LERRIMSKEIIIGIYHAEYCPENKEVCCSNHEVDEYMWFSKQDLLDMLALFEEEKTDGSDH
jgi:NADH pyrophosphatase NudC (nudix superfamily)